MAWSLRLRVHLLFVVVFTPLLVFLGRIGSIKASIDALGSWIYNTLLESDRFRLVGPLVFSRIAVPAPGLETWRQSALYASLLAAVACFSPTFGSPFPHFGVFAVQAATYAHSLLTSCDAKTVLRPSPITLAATETP